ncbi:hypothetical protein G8T76_10730 [Clostridium botulinum C/D]|uniref:hypothetical protein n=1 Tax=Clostridium botulinum TaxID=1491 RepID=UPI000310C72E|nr:hypothetical protein [Clostridium botulinum]KEI02885.1 hypothetical protein Y848_06340 [Clostridium botulinum C/D str. Sp77]KOA76891.1 hypothetical protein ADU78_05390 [Clostridium botulinum]KOA80936.1 hypothetical protein ADU77_00120 [Clostridium botulinum]KOA88962.1 hypothetical protein ADU75_00850 [Clostridium botulinum]KOC31831.1 hypothetical protein ADU83_11920 [Clostridium botulinum]
MSKKYLVVVNKDLENEEIYYCGDIEIEAFKKFKELTYRNKHIVLANVKHIILHGFNLIEKYEVIKKIA